MASLSREELKQRTKQFGLRVMTLCEALPNTRSANVITNQLIRSATSVGANYRAACRARSKADWINKLGIVIEEADESGYWLEYVVDRDWLPATKVAALQKEADELVAIFTAAQMTSKRNSGK